MGDGGQHIKHFHSLSYSTIKQRRRNSIMPEIVGFRRHNWAQIEAALCVSDMGGCFGFDYRDTGWTSSDIVVDYTSSHQCEKIGFFWP